MSQAIRKSGEIWLANLNPNKGSEPGKIRPVLILQAQALLDVFHPSTLIIPLTTSLIEDAYPLRVRIPARDALHKHSDLLIDQVRAIDNRRLLEGPLVKLEREQLDIIYKALSEVIGMP